MNIRQLRSSLARSARAAGLGVALLLAFPTVEFAASFQGLGHLEGGVPPYSIPWDISPNGAIVVGESQSLNGLEAYRWSADTGMVALGSLGGGDFFSTAWRISADGRVIVGASRSPSSGTRTEAFRWTAELGMIGMGDLPGGLFSSSARGVSGDGSVITGVSTSDLAPSWGEVFLWKETKALEGLGTLGGSQIPAGVPWQISRDGTTIVGWSSSENGREAFRWTRSEGMVGLGDLPGPFFDSQATDVSADGSIVLGIASGMEGVTSFRWTAVTGMVDLGRPPGTGGSILLGASADGSVAIGDSPLAGDVVPILWDETHGMRNLVDVLVEVGLGPAMAGWDLETATAISPDGLTVGGWGYNPQGDPEAWLAYLGEPSVVEIPALSNVGLVLFAVLLATGAFLLLRFR
ncbi:MAG: PEP-CTERM sorting domain-containing protein [Thermoanaerobaculia bacterium]